jgi:hypothetical protein
LADAASFGQVPGPVTVTIGRIVIEQPPPAPAPMATATPRTSGFAAFAAQRRGRLR